MKITKNFFLIATISIILTISQSVYGFVMEKDVAGGCVVLSNETINAMVQKEKVAIEVHGIGEGGGWAKDRLPSEYYYYHFQWEKSSVKGMTGGVIIDAALGLAHVIFDIHRAFQMQGKTPTIVILAHSMGGNVAKAALNLFTEKTMTKKMAAIGGMLRTKKAFDYAKKAVSSRLENEKITNETFVQAVYTLGTPARTRFPFDETFLDKKIAENLFVLFSTGDLIQIAAGNRGVKPGKNRYNVKVKIMDAKKKIKNPDHQQLVRDTTIVDKFLTAITTEKLQKNVQSLVPRGKEITSGTVVVTFPRTTADNVIYGFEKKPPKTRWFHKLRMGGIVF